VEDDPGSWVRRAKKKTSLLKRRAKAALNAETDRRIKTGQKRGGGGVDCSRENHKEEARKKKKSC